MRGDLDGALRAEIVQAIGEVKSPPEDALEARRRARDAAADAEALLRSEGYYDAQATGDVADDAAAKPTVAVVTGKRFHVSAARVEWVDGAPLPAPAAAATQALRLPAGAPARAADVIAAEGRVVAALRAAGYADAEARPRQVVVDHADDSLAATFEIAAGARVRLGAVRVTGRTRARQTWLRGLAPWKPGAVYAPALLAKLEKTLLDTGAFEQASVSLAPAAEARDGLRPVIVAIADRPRHTIELGAGYSTTQGSGVDAKYVLYDQLGRADSLTYSARLYDIQQKLDAELDLPGWRRPDQVFKVGGDLLRDRTAAYDDAGGGVRLAVERHYTKTTFITVGAAFDFASTQEKDAVNLLATPVGENLALFVTTLLGEFSLDRSNDPLNPVRGWRLDVSAQPTAVAGDRNLVFLRTQAQVSGYLPLQSDAATVLAGRLKIGSILGGSIPDVPADRRFFSGGGGSVRGFAYQAVGPRLSDNTPEGGLSLIEASFEARQKLTDKWGAAAFIDAGAVGIGPSPSVRDVSTGVGVGVRYNLGFAPIRLDIATPLDRRHGDSILQLYISLGQSF